MPPDPRSQRVLWGALSTVALTLIVLAVPLGLFELGGISVFHVDMGLVAKDISSHRPGDPHLLARWVVRGALILAWISWAWMTTCVALEIRSRLTGRSSARLPASRTVQSLAACLVGTALAVSAIGRVTVVTRANGSRALSAAGAGPAVGAEPGGSATLMPLRVIDDVSPVGRTYRSDEGHDESSGTTPESRVPVVGAPLTGGMPPLDDRWPGRPSIGPSNGFHRSEWEPHGRSTSGPSHVVAPRETLWSIATERLGSALRWREIAELNYDITQSDGGALTAQHWVRPGWTLQLPRSTDQPGAFKADSPHRAARSPGDEDAVIARASAPTELSAVDSLGPSRPPHSMVALDDSPRAAHHGPSVPVVPVGGGVVGAGVVGLLDRMRRVQQRYRSEGTFIRLPDPARRTFEQRLRLGEGDEMVQAVDRALRLFVQAWSDRGSDPPSVLGIVIRHDSIEILIDRAEGCEGLPSCFRSDPGRRSVEIDRAYPQVAGHDEIGNRGSVPPAPLLVTAGHGADGLVMVNLEALGTLLVEGDTDGCEGVVRALALELATSRWSGWFELNVVGFGAELERFERVASVSDLPKLLDRLHRCRFESESLLRGTDFGSLAQARCADYSPRLDPLVVICGPAVAETDVSELLDVASDPRLGLAVVASGTVPGASHVLSLAGVHRTSALEPLSSVLFPQRIEPQDLDDVATLVDTAMNRQSVLRSEEPYVSLPVDMPRTMSAGTPSVLGEDVWVAPSLRPSDRSGDPMGGTAGRVEGSVGERASGRRDGGGRARGRQSDRESELHEVEVAILGQIEIVGAARDFTRAWSKELVVYLAMHPTGASNEAWATALWPDRLMAPSSLHSTASVARRALGQARNGTDHLPRSHGRLVLSDTVGTDWDRFVAHADTNDTARWRTALELVRGRPFEGLRSSDWPILEGIGPAIEAAVVDLSGRLAGSCLAAGDARGAEWSARRGLLVSPYDERLYRMLMRAADVGGNPAGVEAVMAELIKLVANDIEPLDSVHPSTMDLYRSLTRRRNGTSRLFDPTSRGA